MKLFSDLNDPRLRLAEVFERRGARLPVDPLSIDATALATRTCVFCRAKAQCDAWLWSGKREGIERFCPNAEFIELAEDKAAA